LYLLPNIVAIAMCTCLTSVSRITFDHVAC